MTVPARHHVDPVLDALDRLVEALATYHEMRGGETYAEQRAEQREALATVRDRLASQEQELERLREELEDYKHLMEFETSRAEELARQRGAVEAEVRRLREQLDGVTRRPTEAGGPGKEEAYWMRQKLQASIGHLRDIEDYFRVEVGGEPGSYNMARADRARSLYEQMSEDFIHGRLGTPTMRERAEAAEAEVQRLTGERDIWRARYLSTWERMQRIEEVARHAIRQGFLHQHEWVKVLNEADRALLADSPPYTTQARTIDPLSALRPDGGGA